MCNIIRTLCVFGALITLGHCYNILAVFPHYGKSHFLLYERLFKTLASKGHNVTVISYFPQTKTVPNYTDVPLILKDDNSTGGMSFTDFVQSRFQSYGGIFILRRYMEKYCKNGYEDENLQKFLKENNQYDLVLFQIFISECFMGMSKVFNAPVIGKIFDIIFRPTYLKISYLNYLMKEKSFVFKTVKRGD